MKITVTFDSLEEFCANMRINDGFQPIVQEQQNRFEEAKQKLQTLQQEAGEVPEGFTPVEEPPFDETPVETAAAAVTEDFRVEVRKALAKLNKQTGQNTAKDLIKAIGYTKLSEVPLEKLPGLMEKVKEAADA